MPSAVQKANLATRNQESRTLAIQARSRPQKSRRRESSDDIPGRAGALSSRWGTLPEGIALRQGQFCETWMSVTVRCYSLWSRIRNAGWHSMWLADADSHHSIGLTATTAIDKAIARALSRVKVRFNAAELTSVKISKYRGFRITRITRCARHIQTSFTQPG